MTNIPELLTQAGEHQKAGRLREAEVLYRQVVAEVPTRDDIMRLLGVFAYQDNRYQEALQWMERAIALNPNDVESFILLGNLNQTLNYLDSALVAYRQALVLDSNLTEAHYNYGLILQQQAKLPEALEAYQNALRLEPESWQLHMIVGSLLHELNRLEEAEEALQEAIRLNPHSAEAYNNLGLLLRDLKRPSEAIRAFNQAFLLKPDFADAYLNLGQFLHQHNRTEDSIALYERALPFCSDDATVYFDLGGFYQFMNRFDKAEACYRRGLEKQPDSVRGYTNLGYALRIQHRMEEALTAYQQAYQRVKEPIPKKFTVSFFKENPDVVQLKFNEAVLHLMQGDYRRGWELFEWRFDDASPMREFPQPMWDGSPQPGKTLFIWAEQGIGDSIQFLRLLSRVKPLVGKVILEIQPPLVPLLKENNAIDVLFGKGTEDPQHYSFDFHLPLQSLAYLFAVELEDLPVEKNYLQADPAKISFWKKRLEEAPGLKIGFVWSSNPHCIDVHRRSCRFEHFYPLFELPGISWFSLQKGVEPTAEQRAFVANQPVTFLGHEFNDFGDTAAVMANLDLVISVDTSVPHLAGAMGKPVWTLIANAADWRWLQHRTDTPWYPSMRLFRQPALGDWKRVMRAVQESLTELLHP